MPLSRNALALAAALLLGACGAPQSLSTDPSATQLGPLRISNVWMRTPAAGSGADAVYMVIANTGAQPDQLIRAATSVAPTVELHQTTADQGVMSMRQVDGIPVPAGGAVAIESGAYHLMLLGRTAEVHAGDHVTVTLTFASAGTIALPAEVRDAAPSADSHAGGGEHHH